MTIENLGHQVTREYCHDGQVVIYTVVGGGQAITDTWANAMIAETRAWNPQQPYLTLQDMSQSGISTYGKKRTDDIIQNIPTSLRVYVAIVVEDTLFGRFIKMLTKSVSQSHQDKQFVYRFFTSREAGLAWLISHLAYVPKEQTE